MRAVKNNNPLNIRYKESNKWQGQVAENKGFCVFSTPEWGWRAAMKLVNSYIKRGYNTIDKLVTRWAPPSENDSKSYVRFVQRKVYEETDRITALGEIKPNTPAYFYMLQAMAQMEQRLPVSIGELKHIYNDYKIES